MPRVSSANMETKKSSIEYINEIKRDRLNFVLINIKHVLKFREGERDDNSNFARDLKSLYKFYYDVTRDPTSEQLDEFLDYNPCSKSFEDVMDWCDKRIVRYQFILTMIICYKRKFNTDFISLVKGHRKFGDTENAVRALDIDLRNVECLTLEVQKSKNYFESKTDIDFIDDFYDYVADLPFREKELERINEFFYKKMSEGGYGSNDNLKEKSSSIFKHIYLNSNKFQDLRKISEKDDVIEYARHLVRKIKTTAYAKSGQECFVERIKCILKDIGDKRATIPMIIEKVNKTKNYERFAQKSSWHEEIVTKLQEAYQRVVSSANPTVTIRKTMIIAIGYLEKMESLLKESLAEEASGTYFLRGFSDAFCQLETYPQNILKLFLERCSLLDFRKLLEQTYVSKIAVKNEKVKSVEPTHSAENFIFATLRMFKLKNVFSINCIDNLRKINILQFLSEIPNFRYVLVDDENNISNVLITDEDTNKIIEIAKREKKYKIVFAIQLAKELCLRPQEMVAMTINDVIVYTNKGDTYDIIEYENSHNRGYRGTQESRFVIDDFSSKDYHVASKITILVKNQNLRDIVIDKPTRAIIANYLKFMYGEETPNPRDYLFPQRNKNKPISGEYLSKQFKMLRDKCGITNNISIYNYKHTKVTKCINEGMSISEVAKLMGNLDEDVIEKHYYIKQHTLYRTIGTQYEQID